MRRITLWLFATVAAMVLLFSYRTSTMGTGAGGAAGAGAAPRVAVTGGAAGDGNGDNATGTTGAAPSAGASANGGTTSGGTYKGKLTQTRWGPVQVTITVSNGKITKVSVPTYPNGNGRDQEINAYALPILVQSTLDAQSAKIDTVSGATVTSRGYITSLQSALDAAHLS